MKNREKFAKEIIDLALQGKTIAFNKNYNVVPCEGLDCKLCWFNESKGIPCDDIKRAWAEEEYVEPVIDWTKVPVDTPILVKDSESGNWIRRYFAYYNDGVVNSYIDGATSWSSCGIVEGCKYAKLAEYYPCQDDVDWNNIPIDTKILVRNSTNSCWYLRRFAGYSDGMVQAFADGGTSKMTDCKLSWKFCMLYEGK